MSLKRRLSEEDAPTPPWYTKDLPFEEYNIPQPDEPRRRFAKVASAEKSSEFHTLNTWDITPELRVSIVSHRGQNLRIHLRRYEGTRATNQGVTMCRKTWAEFAGKFRAFDVALKDSGYVANNEVLVCVNENHAILQNLFSFKKGNFGLKSAFLVMSKWEVEKLYHELENLNNELSQEKLKYYFCYKND